MTFQTPTDKRIMALLSNILSARDEISLIESAAGGDKNMILLVSGIDELAWLRERLPHGFERKFHVITWDGMNEKLRGSTDPILITNACLARILGASITAIQQRDAKISELFRDLDASLNESELWRKRAQELSYQRSVLDKLAAWAKGVF